MNKKARIYSPAKSPTQSGTKTTGWVLEFEQDGSREIDPIMGWTSTKDPEQQIRMTFKNKELAVKYANSHDIDYEIYEPKVRKIKPKSYSANFS